MSARRHPSCTFPPKPFLEGHEKLLIRADRYGSTIINATRDLNNKMSTIQNSIDSVPKLGPAEFVNPMLLHPSSLDFKRIVRSEVRTIVGSGW